MKSVYLFGLLLVATTVRVSAVPAAEAGEEQPSAFQAELIVSLGHSGTLTSKAFSPDGRLIVTGARDGTARLWSTIDGQELRLFRTEAQVKAVAFSPDGALIVTGSDASGSWEPNHPATLWLWDTATGKAIHNFGAYEEGVTSIGFSRDGRQVLTAGEGIHVWEVSTGKTLQTFGQHMPQPESVFSSRESAVFSSDDVHVVQLQKDGPAILWQNGIERQRLTGGSGSISSAAFSTDGSLLAIGDSAGDVQILEIESLAEKLKFKAYETPVWWVTFAPDGGSVLTDTGSSDGNMRHWDVFTGAMLHDFGNGNYDAEPLFSPDGRYVLVSERSEGILWDAASGVESWRLKGDTLGRVESVAFSKDGNTLLTMDGDGIRVWGIQRVGPTSSTSVALSHDRDVGDPWDSEAVFSSDGRHILSRRGMFSPAYLWDAFSGAEARALGKGSSNTMADAVAYSPDGQSVLTANDGIITRWDVSTGKEVNRYSSDCSCSMKDSSAFDSRFERVQETGTPMSQEEALAAVAANQPRLSEPVCPSSEPANGKTYSLAISPSGRLFATSGAGGVRLWDVDSGAVVRCFRGRGLVLAMAFSPDDRFLLTGDNSHDTRLWDVASGRTVKTFWQSEFSPSFHPFTRSVAFSADGLLALTTHDEPHSPWSNSYVVIWEVRTGLPYRIITIEGSGQISAALSPDGKLMLAGTQRSAQLWDITSGRKIAELFSFSDGAWAVVDQIGRFDASSGGDIQGLHWVVGIEAIELGQLKDHYYEPDLLAKILGVNKEPIRDVVALTEFVLYPDVQLEALTADSSLLEINLHNRGGGLGQVVVAINGKEIVADARGDGFDTAAKDASIAIDITNHPNIIPGVDNTLEVKVYNDAGSLVSRGENFILRASGVEVVEPPEFWAVIAGVSDYRGDALDLNFAARDAVAFSEALRLGAESLFGTEKVHITLLSTDDPSANLLPTRDNLILALNELTNAKPTDVVLVYLSGHGITGAGQDGDYYFLTQQATSFDLSDSAIRSAVALSSSDLTELFLKIPVAGKQVLILDTCGAGRAVENFTQTQPVPSSQTRALEINGGRANLFILAGAAANAASYEASVYRQGLLTYSLLEGMRGAVAMREDKFLDVYQWFDYARGRVPELAQNIGGVQHPMRLTPSLMTNLEIAQLLRKDREKIQLTEALPPLIQVNFGAKGSNIDGLGLTQAVNEALRALASSDAKMPWAFFDAPAYVNSYRLSGTFVENETKDEVVVDVYLSRDSVTVDTKTVTGTTTRMDSLVADIIAFAKEKL